MNKRRTSIHLLDLRKKNQLEMKFKINNNKIITGEEIMPMIILEIN